MLVDWTDLVLVGCWAMVRRLRLAERRGGRNQDDGGGQADYADGGEGARRGENGTWEGG